MIENIPNWINILFIVVTCATIGMFYISNGKPNKILWVIIAWSIIQSIVAYTGFYQVTDTIPPRFILVLLPTTLVIIYGLTSKKLNWVYTNRKTEISTFLHSIRFPVEINSITVLILE